MIEALGLSYPDLFLTLAKMAGGACVVFYAADQFLGVEEEFDD